MTDDTPVTAFKHFVPSFPDIHQLQLVINLEREKTYPGGLAIRKLVTWLIHIDLMKKKT